MALDKRDGAYYKSSEQKLPWKISWDPTRSGSDLRSYELIDVVDSGDAWTENPDTYERTWNYSVSDNPLPLRHTVFRADVDVDIYVKIGGSWEYVANGVGIEGETTESTVFLIRRDIPLSDDTGFNVGRSLRRGEASTFLGGHTFDDVSTIRVELIYIGDYVLPESFDQDLHPDANIQIRSMRSDISTSTNLSLAHTQSQRHARILKEIRSPFLRAEEVNDSQGTSQNELNVPTIRSHSLVSEMPSLRTGLHTIEYDDVELDSSIQAHSGDWSASATYRELKRVDGVDVTHKNFILSHGQTPRVTSNEETERQDELAFQYDATEGWQAGTGADTYRRSVDTSETPKISRRYPLLARLSQGLTDSTNEGFIDTSAPSESLSRSPSRMGLFTSESGRPDLLRRHSRVWLEESSERVAIRGQSSLQLFEPGRDTVENPYVTWNVLEGGETVELEVGAQATRRPESFLQTWKIRPFLETDAANEQVNIRTLALNDSSNRTAPYWLTEIMPSGVSQYVSITRIGLIGHGTDSYRKNYNFGDVDRSATFHSVARTANKTSSFDVVYNKNVLLRARGNSIFEGIVDSYHDFAFGRRRSTESQSVNLDETTLERKALLRGSYSDDTVEINKEFSGRLNVHGTTLAMRRLAGPTVARIDQQLRASFGWPTKVIPTVDKTDFLDYKPYLVEDDIELTRDEVDPDTNVSLRSTGRGHVDAYNASYISHEYESAAVVSTDWTDSIIAGIDSVDGSQVRSGFVRGQLQRDGYTARGQFADPTLPVFALRDGIPGELASAGEPEHQLNSSDMYLDADGRWRYIFDQVLLPVETA